jgi:hypothetical protein
MVEVSISRSPGVKVLALVVGMAGIALLDISHIAVCALSALELCSYATVTIQAQGGLLRLEWLVATAALCLEGFMRCKTLQGHARLAYGAQPARAESQPQCARAEQPVSDSITAVASSPNGDKNGCTLLINVIRFN